MTAVKNFIFVKSEQSEQSHNTPMEAQGGEEV
jgi:hypothetical protein